MKSESSSVFYLYLLRMYVKSSCLKFMIFSILGKLNISLAFYKWSKNSLAPSSTSPSEKSSSYYF